MYMHFREQMQDAVYMQVVIVIVKNIYWAHSVIRQHQEYHLIKSLEF